jgi:hypothetical protein
LKKGEILRSKHVYSNALEGSKNFLKFDSNDHQSATFWAAKGAPTGFKEQAGGRIAPRNECRLFWGDAPLFSVL